MTDQTPPAGFDWEEALCQWALRWYGVHRALYATAVFGMHVVNIWQGAPWWALWPTMIWGVPFCIHYFLYKSITVDESWADERIDDLREKSYDIAHMTDLEDRIVDDDHSTRPAHRRDPDWWQHPPHDAGDGSGEKDTGKGPEDR